jgi:hypothetical protein
VTEYDYSRVHRGGRARWHRRMVAAGTALLVFVAIVGTYLLAR